MHNGRAGGHARGRRVDGRRRGAARRRAAGAAEGALQPLPEGAFYHIELVGCDVTTDRRTAARHGPGGRARQRAATGWSIGHGREKFLVPLVDADSACRVDVAARRIVIDPPAGLLDVNRADGRPSMKFDIVTIFPRMFDAAAGRGRRGAGSRGRGRSTWRSTTCATSRPTGTASSTTCRMAAGRAW